MKRWKSAALIVVIAAAATVVGVGSARARVGSALRRSLVVDPCASLPAAGPRCNALVLADQQRWHGNRVTTDVLPSVPLPTLPSLPPLTLPNLLSPATTTTTTEVATTTSTAAVTTTTEAPIIGFGPTALQSAYGIDHATDNSTNTIAVIEGNGAPNAANDLAVYRSHFGLPECSIANGCLRIVDEKGNDSQVSSTDDVWALETATDLDMASAMCPSCHLLVVQAADTLADLATANLTAAQLGADVINDSWGYPDNNDGTHDDSAYTHSHAVTVAASGDVGYQTDSEYPDGIARFPASSPNVVAVGGTSLSSDNSRRGWAETAFAQSESGCSTFYPKPTWQASLPCSFGRADADVAAVADPSTGVAVYDSQGYGGEQGWMTLGGTSVSSAIISGVFGAAGNGAVLASDAPHQLYGHSGDGDLNDVTAGSNGTCTDARCNAGPGWDGPTGNGTPAGVAAF